MGSPALDVEDRTVYPVEERVGEDILQRWIVELLRPLIDRWLRERAETCFVGADQFLYFEQYNPGKRVAPDVYVLPNVASDTHVRSWKAWETKIVPSFALEIVSLDWEKDYIDAPQAHAELGTQELFIFDPLHTERRDGVRWQRYTRSPAGRFTLAQRTDDDRIASAVLGCLLRVVGFQQKQRLRLGLAPDGEVLFPTEAEAEEAAKEEERRAKEAALERVAELEAMLKLRS